MNQTLASSGSLSTGLHNHLEPSSIQNSNYNYSYMSQAEHKVSFLIPFYSNSFFFNFFFYVNRVSSARATAETNHSSLVEPKWAANSPLEF